MSTTLWVGLALAGCALAWDLLLPVRRTLRAACYLLCAASSACLLAVGAGALAGSDVRIDLHHLLALPAGGLRVDRLSALFLVICFGVAVPVSLAMADWSRLAGRIRSRGVGAGFALTGGATAVVVCADNAFVLMFGWELLGFAFYLLAGARRDDPDRTRASVVAMTFSKVGGAFLLLGLLALAARSGSWQLASFAHVTGDARDVAYVLLVAGFATKAGLVPVHVWLPPTYSSAPGPTRALMAGSAVNVGFYGLWRTLAILGRPPVWLVVVVLLLAGFTAILGIAHAAVQTRLSRVIAYSSVENTGLIIVGYGVALAGSATGSPRLVAAGLLAATMQASAHAVAKSLLFTTAGTIEEVFGSDELGMLNAVRRRLPVSGAGLGIGCLTLAALPPTIGFVSEWLLLESLMQQFRLPGLALKLALAAAGALVALTVGFASVTFARLLGFVVLGHSPDTETDAGEAGWLGRISVGALSLGCLAIAAITPLQIRLVAAGISPVVPARFTMGALKGPWVLQPVFADFSILSPSWLWVVLPAMFVATVAIGFAASRARMFQVRRVPAWRSATGGVSGDDRYTAFGYTNPTRKVLANVLLTRTELNILQHQTGPTAEGADTTRPALADDGLPPEERPEPVHAHLGYTSDVIELVGAFVYEPLIAATTGLVRVVKRLQSGRLDAYMAYMLVVLVAALAVVTALK